MYFFQNKLVSVLFFKKIPRKLVIICTRILQRLDRGKIFIYSTFINFKMEYYIMVNKLNIYLNVELQSIRNPKQNCNSLETNLSFN